MNEDRKAIETALKQQVLPLLRESGFKGSMPQFRRIGSEELDLLRFQFDIYGGEFVIELARCSQEGYLTLWGAKISPDKVSTFDLPFDTRHRIQPRPGGSSDSWFRFENGRIAETVSSVLNMLPTVEAWFRDEGRKSTQ